MIATTANGTPAEQRWTHGTPRFVTPANTFDPRGWEVAPMPHDADARAFVVTHHYSRSYPAALRRFGLYAPGGALQGVAVYSVSANDRALREFPGTPRESCELGRLVLLDAVGFNAETWFVSRCHDALRREGWVGVMSMSDPVPRVALDGTVTHRGHIGVIYQALNAVYVGRASPGTLHVLPDGSVFNNRAASKIRALDRGWRYAVGQLVEQGAPAWCAADAADPSAWLRRALGAIARRVRHPGNHKYLWGLQRASRRHVAPLAVPYPRVVVPAG